MLDAVSRAGTGGGTSERRFIVLPGAEVAELGPSTGKIHKIDKHVALVELERLPDLHSAIGERLLG